jgi:hypothetical protein
MTTFCAACPVRQGQCPDCGTFWLIAGNGKRYGVKAVTTSPTGPTTDFAGRIVILPPLDDLPNVVKR